MVDILDGFIGPPMCILRQRRRGVRLALITKLFKTVDYLVYTIGPISGLPVGNVAVTRCERIVDMSPPPLRAGGDPPRRARMLLGGVDAVLLSDYGYSTLASTVRPFLIQAARTRGIPCGADSRYQLTEYRGVTVATPNEEEFGAILGSFPRTDAGVTAAGRELVSRLGTRGLVLTRGSRGMRVFGDNGDWRDVPAGRQGEVVDVTGAGDTVASTLVLALAAGSDILGAAVLANAAASVVVTRRGAATATQEEVARALRGWPDRGRP